MDFSDSNKPDGGSSGSDDYQYQYKDQGNQGTSPPPSSPPPPPPPPRSRGFNWLACCGISCLVLLILGGGVSYCTYLAVKPFMNMGLEMESIMSSVSSADIAEVRSAAIPTTPGVLSSDSEGLADQWLELEGVITGDGGDMSGQYGSDQSTGYLLDHNTIVIDTSGSARVGLTGDTIRAYGKVFGWDLSELGKIPLIGPFIEEEMAKDPQMGGNTKIIFFLAREVELVGERKETPDDSDTSDADSASENGMNEKQQDDGWL